MYRISGLTVACDLCLPGVVAAETCGRADIDISAAPRIEDLDDPVQEGPNWAMRGDTFVIAVPAVARFRVSEGRRIDYAPEPGGDQRDVAAFLLGSIFGILLHQRALLVLHASAVEVDGAAILFCGRSGAGKSTLAAALNQRGHGLLADDICAIDMSGPTAMAQPDARCLRLWAESGDRLGLTERRRNPVRPSIAKFHFEPQARPALEARPIAAIYVLREDKLANPPRIETLNVAEAASTLRRQSYRPPLITLLNQEELYFRSAARLVAQVDLFALVRPLDFGMLDQIVARLEEHWSEIGPGSRAA